MGRRDEWIEGRSEEAKDFDVRCPSLGTRRCGAASSQSSTAARSLMQVASLGLP